MSAVTLRWRTAADRRCPVGGQHRDRERRQYGARGAVAHGDRDVVVHADLGDRRSTAQQSRGRIEGTPGRLARDRKGQGLAIDVVGGGQKPIALARDDGARRHTRDRRCRIGRRVRRARRDFDRESRQGRRLDAVRHADDDVAIDACFVARRRSVQTPRVNVELQPVRQTAHGERQRIAVRVAGLWLECVRVTGDHPRRGCAADCGRGVRLREHLRWRC